MRVKQIHTFLYVDKYENMAKWMNFWHHHQPLYLKPLYVNPLTFSGIRVRISVTYKNGQRALREISDSSNL
jgi:hypothetical protein